MIDAILIEDEFKVREVLKIKLQKNCPQVNIIGEADSVASGLLEIERKGPKLVFLDIQLPDGTGFDLLNRLETWDFEIVFVTGYDSYAVEAFKVSAVHYLLKPIRTRDLQEAVSRCEETFSDKSYREKFSTLHHNLNRSPSAEPRITIPGAQEYSFLNPSEVIHLSGWDKYTKIHTTHKGVFTSSYHIGYFREVFESNGFVTIHKSHIINPIEIVVYNKKGFVVMSDRKEIPVARRRREKFIQTVVDRLSIDHV